MDLRRSESYPGTKRKPRIRLDRVNVSDLGRVVRGGRIQEEDTLLWTAESTEDIGNKAAILATALVEGPYKLCRDTSARPGPVWWTRVVAECKATAQRLRRLTQRRQDTLERQDLRRAYLEPKKAFRKKLRSSKRREWKRFEKEQDKADKWGLHSKVARGKITSRLAAEPLGRGQLGRELPTWFCSTMPFGRMRGRTMSRNIFQRQSGSHCSRWLDYSMNRRRDLWHHWQAKNRPRARGSWSRSGRR